MHQISLWLCVALCLGWLGGSCDGFGQFHMKHYQLQRGYNSPDDSSENDNSVLRKYLITNHVSRVLVAYSFLDTLYFAGTYRRCMWEQSKFLPRRLVLLSLCSNLFCENNQIVPRSRSIFVVEKMSRPNE